MCIQDSSNLPTSAGLLLSPAICMKLLYSDNFFGIFTGERDRCAMTKAQNKCAQYFRSRKYSAAEITRVFSEAKAHSDSKVSENSLPDFTFFAEPNHTYYAFNERHFKLLK